MEEREMGDACGGERDEVDGGGQGGFVAGRGIGADGD